MGVQPISLGDCQHRFPKVLNRLPITIVVFDLHLHRVEDAVEFSPRHERQTARCHDLAYLGESQETFFRGYEKRVYRESVRLLYFSIVASVFSTA
jgi:hypothetical protein